MLLRFHQSDRYRQGREAKLAQLREASRGIIRTFLAHPELRKQYWIEGDGIEPYKGKPYEALVERPNIFARLLHGAPMFSETPEETISTYRMLLTGDAFPLIRNDIFQLYPTDPLLLGGWVSSSKQRERALWESLVAELAASTNYLLHLESLILEKHVYPNRAEAINKKIRAFIRQNHDALMEEKAPRLSRELLDNEDYELDREWERFRNQRLRAKSELRPLDLVLNKSGALSSSSADLNAFAMARRVEMSPRQASNYLTRIEKYLAEATDEKDRLLKSNVVRSLQSSLRRSLVKTNALKAVTRPKAIVQLEPASPIKEAAMITISDNWNVPPAELGLEKLVSVRLGIPVLWQDTLWFHCHYHLGLTGGSAQNPAALLGVSVKDLKLTHKVPLEEEFVPDSRKSQYWWPRGILVRDGEFFLRGRTRFWWGPLENPKLHSLPMPAEDAELFEVRGRIYLASADAIFELLTKENRFETLASLRRKGDENDLEKMQSFGNPLLTAGPGETLRCFTQNSFLRSNQTWINETRFTLDAPGILNGERLLMFPGKPYTQSTKVYLLRPELKQPELLAMAQRDKNTYSDEDMALRPKWLISKDQMHLFQPHALERYLLSIQRNPVEERKKGDPYGFFLAFPWDSKEGARIPFAVKRPSDVVLPLLVQPMLNHPWLVETKDFLLCGEHGDAIFFRISKGALEDSINSALQKSDRPE